MVHFILHSLSTETHFAKLHSRFSPLRELNNIALFLLQGEQRGLPGRGLGRSGRSRVRNPLPATSVFLLRTSLQDVFLLLLSNNLFRLLSVHAVTLRWCFFFLGAYLIQSRSSRRLDYPVQRCLGKHGVHTVPFLDAGGCHAASGCKSSIGARSKKHMYLSRVVVQAAKRCRSQCYCRTRHSWTFTWRIF